MVLGSKTKYIYAFYNQILYYICICVETRTKIDNKRPVLADILKIKHQICLFQVTKRDCVDSTESLNVS